MLEEIKSRKVADSGAVPDAENNDQVTEKKAVANP